MEELLIKYLKSSQYSRWEYINIDTWGLNGADCVITFHTDKSHTTTEYEVINIWQMILFLNK